VGNKKNSKKMILVNIHNSLREGKSNYEAIRRAWNLRQNECLKHDFVVGVSGGDVIDIFRLVDVIEDEEDSSRVAFELKECSSKEYNEVMDRIENECIGRKGFVEKYV
jgi:hypothetical protein